MNNSLKDRYIYAVIKKLPAKMRGDVKKELDSLISDMLEERCGEIIPTQHDERVVLTELGSPDELAHKYRGDEDECLIGGIYYTHYKTVLKIVLIAVAGGLTIAHLILNTIEADTLWYIGLFNYFSNTIIAIFFAASFVTIIFAIMHKKNANISFNGLDNLPDIPSDKDEIPISEPISAICLSVAFVIVFLFIPQIAGMWMGQGEFIPIFNIDVLRKLWYIPVVFAVLGIIRDSIKLIEARHSYKLMIAVIIVDVLSAPIAIFWLTYDNIANPQFSKMFTDVVGNTEPIVMNMLSSFPKFFLIILLFALALDLVTNVVKTIRFNRIQE